MGAGSGIAVELATDEMCSMLTNTGAASYTKSGDRWGVVTFVDSGGGMEIGQYLDFHNSDGDTSDNAIRLQTGGTTDNLQINGFPIGAHRLTSGAPSGVASTSIVLSSYTQYRTILIHFSFLPATDATVLQTRFSTNAGSSYDSGATDYSHVQYGLHDGSTTMVTAISAGDTKIDLNRNAANTLVGNGSGEGISGVLALYDRTDTAKWSRIWAQISAIGSNATPQLFHNCVAGARRTAQDTDAIQFFFSSGNLSGVYHVFGLY
jgi:hypothetical protein